MMQAALPMRRDHAAAMRLALVPRACTAGEGAR